MQKATCHQGEILITIRKILAQFSKVGYLAC